MKQLGADDVTQLALEERQDPCTLIRPQAGDDDLASALGIIQRSAQRLAKIHDDRVSSSQTQCHHV